MQMITTLSSGADVTTYVKAPTWDGKRVPQWYAYVMSSFETCMGTSLGNTSQIA